MMNVFFLDEKCDEKKSIEIGLSSIKSGYLNIVFQKENNNFFVLLLVHLSLYTKKASYLKLLA